MFLQVECWHSPVFLLLLKLFVKENLGSNLFAFLLGISSVRTVAWTVVITAWRLASLPLIKMGEDPNSQARQHLFSQSLQRWSSQHGGVHSCLQISLQKWKWETLQVWAAPHSHHIHHIHICFTKTASVKYFSTCPHLLLVWQERRSFLSDFGLLGRLAELWLLGTSYNDIIDIFSKSFRLWNQ